MHGEDRDRFVKMFQRLCETFRMKLKPVEFERLANSYFAILDAHRLDDVLEVGTRLLRKHRTFPKPADWLAELETGLTAQCPADRRVMTSVEVAELTQAEAMRYEGQPCLCHECVRAGIDTQPLRFVPTMKSFDEEERAFHPKRNRVEVVGHWAHGEELRRWYEARDAFYAKARSLGVKPNRLGFVYVPPAHAPRRPELLTTREPGEEG
jgi:hypothetical protein